MEVELAEASVEALAVESLEAESVELESEEDLATWAVLEAALEASEAALEADTEAVLEVDTGVVTEDQADTAAPVVLLAPHPTMAPQAPVAPTKRQLTPLDPIKSNDHYWRAGSGGWLQQRHSYGYLLVALLTGFGCTSLQLSSACGRRR